MSPIYVPGKVVLRKTWQPMDADAAAYITAVETADGQALEEKTKIAIDNFVLGCKADGIWTAIKASCILAGARTLTGALVPLVGTAPTNNNFDSGDYNRKTGLLSAATKYLNSNRANNADPQNSKHVSVYATTVGGAVVNAFYLGTDVLNNGDTLLGTNTTPGSLWGRLHTSGNATFTSVNATGLIGLQRNSSAGYVLRNNANNFEALGSSMPPSSQSIGIFAAGNGNYRVTARLAFYSIGESLDLARLDARVTDLINAFGAAIP
jgi:hypothetical protein